MGDAGCANDLLTQVAHSVRDQTVAVHAVNRGAVVEDHTVTQCRTGNAGNQVGIDVRQTFDQRSYLGSKDQRLRAAWRWAIHNVFIGRAQIAGASRNGVEGLTQINGEVQRTFGRFHQQRQRRELA